MLPDLFQVKFAQQIVRAIAPARAHDRSHVVTHKHFFQLANSSLNRSGKIKILLQNRIEIKRLVSRSPQGFATGIQFRPLDVAGRRDDAYGIAGSKGRNFHELTARRRHGSKAAATLRSSSKSASAISSQPSAFS